jgi:Leucine-rich repeat (LRR) protein
VQRLSLRDNYITELPLEMHELGNGALTLFDINDNGLKSPPPEIAAKGLEAMFDYMRRMFAAQTSLVLDLSDLGLTYLPAEVMRFHATQGIEAVGLTSLILDGNDLTWLPAYLRNMTTLTCLSLRHCNFTELPYFIGDLRQLEKLKIIRCQRNGLIRRSKIHCQTLKDSPQPQRSRSLGLLNLKPSFKPSRTKSSSVPSK